MNHKQYKSSLFNSALYTALLVLTTTSLPVASEENRNTVSKRSAPVFEEVVALSTDDLPAIMERNFLRVLVSYNRTSYFLDKDLHPRGLEYDLMQAYGDYLNRSVEPGKGKTHVVFLPMPFNQLQSALLAGKGDVIAAQLAVTPERKNRIAFTKPYFQQVSEVLVTHKSVKAPHSLEDLSGHELYLLRGSSYKENIQALSKRLEEAGKAPIKIIEASENLTSEDILELVNAGIVKMTIADSHLAELWLGVFPQISVHSNITASTGGEIAWAVRKNNPELLQSLNGFVEEGRKGSLFGNIVFKRYYKNATWIKNPLAKEEKRKLMAVIDIFKKYAEQYDFDYLTLLALAYEESALDHTKRSKAGAIGIMQIKQKTAEDKYVGIQNIDDLDNNIHAGTKYLAWLRNTYFSGSEISESNRVNFSLAAYNAGPGRIAQMRRKTAEKGLDPNKWFKNVELVVREHVGPEPIGYVKAIHKYYVAFRLLLVRRDLRTTDNEIRQMREKRKKESQVEDADEPLGDTHEPL